MHYSKRLQMPGMLVHMMLMRVPPPKFSELGLELMLAARS